MKFRWCLHCRSKRSLEYWGFSVLFQCIINRNTNDENQNSWKNSAENKKFYKWPSNFLGSTFHWLSVANFDFTLIKKCPWKNSFKCCCSRCILENISIYLSKNHSNRYLKKVELFSLEILKFTLCKIVNH